MQDVFATLGLGLSRSYFQIYMISGLPRPTFWLISHHPLA